MTYVIKNTHILLIITLWGIELMSISLIFGGYVIPNNFVNEFALANLRA